MLIRRLVRPVFDNPELNGGGGGQTTDPTPVEPAEPATPAEPAEPAEPDAGGDPAEAGRLAAVKAERTRRQAAEADARTAREEAAYYRGLAERPATPVVPQAPVAPAGPPEAPVEPQANQYEDYADYEAAHKVWQQKDRQYVIDVTTYNVEKRLDSKNQQSRQQQTVEQQVTAFKGRLAEEAALDPDIVNIANTFHLPGPNHLPLTDAMQDAIRESDVGPKLLRHFANNKAEVLRLAALSPVTQLREIGRIEAGILNKPQPVVKHVTSAPEPVKPLGGGTAVVDDDDKVPMQEYLNRERLRAVERRKRS